MLRDLHNEGLMDSRLTPYSKFVSYQIEIFCRLFPMFAFFVGDYDIKPSIMTSKILGIKISAECKSPANLRMSFVLKSKIQKAKVHFILMLFTIFFASQPANAQQIQNQTEQQQ